MAEPCAGRDIDWNDLRCLLAVADKGSLAAAARHLGVAHTTVARRIRALEKSLDTDFIERQGTETVLTPGAFIAVEAARGMASAVDGLTARTRGLNRQIEGEIRLNVTEGLANFWLMPRLQEFQRRHPSITVSWFIINTSWAEVGREVDIALRLNKPMEPYVVAVRIGAMRYSLFASAAYVEANGLPRDVGEFGAHRFLHMTAYEANPDLAPWCDLMRKYPPAMKLENTGASTHAILAGGVLGLLPDYAKLIDPGLVRVPLDLGINLNLWLAYHEDRRDTPRVHAVVDEIRRLAEADRNVWFS